MTQRVQVSTDWSINGVDAVIVENSLIRAVFLPQLGGKLWQFTYKPRSTDLLWHNPRIRPRAVPFNSAYDDVFFGGWDELFPNDMPEEVHGERMPDHGEVWALPWDCAVEDASPQRVVVHLWVETPISACRLDKWVTVVAGEPCLRIRQRVVNGGALALPYLWKLHAAVAIDQGSRIDIGAGRMYVEDFGTPRNGATGVSYEWPFLTDTAGLTHDMRLTLPVTAQACEFQYATELTAGWCAVTDPAKQVGLGLAFDPTVFSSCWTFASYGGWRGLHVVVLEPCTGYPISVADGLARGTHRRLDAGESLETEVTAVAFNDFVEVSGIDIDGAVRGRRKDHA